MQILKSTENLTKEELLSIALKNRDSWMTFSETSKEDKEEALKLSDEALIARFTTLLTFGTAGIRGEMQAGLAAINSRTIALVTTALASLIKEKGLEERGVVIACDSRNNSQYFSNVCASILAREGIKTYIFESLRPTPELSFAILQLKCAAGINITASHNTKEYNGYKCYWSDGAQIEPEMAKEVASRSNEIDIEKVLTGLDFEGFVKAGKITIIGSDMDEKYLSAVLEQSVCREIVEKVSDDLKIVYTPIHGSGYKLVPEVLKRDGFKNIVTVSEQMAPNGEFPTVSKPNPQFEEVFVLGIKKADEVHADLIVATDPDADRAGIAVKDKEGKFVTITGNQTGCLILDFLITIKKLNNTLKKNACVIKSLVSTELADVICDQNNIAHQNVYTGFKYIGEKINEFQKTGEYSFLFGFEESYGYLTGEYTRDKDAVLATLLICEMAAYYKSQGMTIYDALMALYEKYGYRAEFLQDVKITSLDFKTEVSGIMNKLRENPPKTLGTGKVLAMNDYLRRKRIESESKKESDITLSSENMLSFEIEDDCMLIVRPSGTEPKMKLYLFIKADDPNKASVKKDDIIQDLGFVK